ncbi:MAG: hypothetical protein H6713_35685 [Myxococcales bacterium]|nr:hypothetical protein [Myxococcales bacterium]MCB9755313.1 hypothetical protein [Myxococcales bacterium]
MGGSHHVYLVPGFFGFANFGDFKYFAHVRRVLPPLLAARGVAASLHEVRVLPTSSLPRRASTLLETIDATSVDGDHVHIVGHSTGGLDARLLLAPGAELPTTRDVPRVLARARSVISVATPHRGSPLADVLSSVLGQQLLRVLSTATIHTIRVGRVPLPIITRFTDVLAPVSTLVGARGGILEQLYRDLLHDFSDEHAELIEEFFRKISADRSLLPQLAPPAMELFNTRCTRRSEVRYGSVVLQAKPPTLGGVVKTGLGPFGQASYALYRTLHSLIAQGSSGAADLTSAQLRTLRRDFGVAPTPEANDAIVPTLSQVRDEVIAAVWADHLDILGFFEGPSHAPPHNDWLRSLSGFGLDEFTAAWSRVADFIAGVDAKP